MLLVGTLLARTSTARTPFSDGPTVTRTVQGRAPSSPRLSATPPPLGRRRLRLMFSKFHLLPRCWSSTTSTPFFRPISLRFCPSRPVRLKLSSQSRPASSPLGAGLEPAEDGGLIGSTTDGAAGDACCPGFATRPAARLEATPVASGLVVSPVDTV